MHDKRQNDQLELAFEVSGEGEAQSEGVEGTESSTAEDGNESLAEERLMEEVLRRHWPKLREHLLNGRYRPQPVLRKEIKKPDGGGMRQLGIPTVRDRFIQQALHQVLQEQWDASFSEHSYGFRPNRQAHQAGQPSYRPQNLHYFAACRVGP